MSSESLGISHGAAKTEGAADRARRSMWKVHCAILRKEWRDTGHNGFAVGSSYMGMTRQGADRRLASRR